VKRIHKLASVLVAFVNASEITATTTNEFSGIELLCLLVCLTDLHTSQYLKFRE